jgi:hypothetical protein
MLGVPFRRIWCINFEFIAREGENLEPSQAQIRQSHISTGRARKWRSQRH